MNSRRIVLALVLALRLDAGELTPLLPGAPASRTIAGGETHSFSVTIAPGQYVRVEVTQTSIDVGVSAEGAGMPRREIDTYSIREGPEVLHLVAVDATPVTVGVHARTGHGRAATSGQYEIALQDFREATRQDRLRLDTQTAYTTGMTLRGQMKAEQVWAAIPHLETAVRLANESGDLTDRATSLLQLASTYQMARENDAALRSFEAVLPLLRQLGWTRNVGLTYTSIGWIQDARGEYQKALESHQRALEVLSAEPDGANGHPAVLASIGLAFFSLGDMRSAIEQYEKALSLYRTANNPRGEGVILHDLGQVYAAIGDAARAMPLFDEALKLHQKTGNKRREPQTLTAIARLHSTRGDVAQALPMFERALESTRAGGDRRLEAIILDEIGEVHLQRGDLEASRTRYIEALALQRSMKDRRNEALSLYGLARVERRAGKLAEALAAINEAVGIVESIREGVQPRDLRVFFRAATHDLYETQIDILMALHQSAPDANWDQQALEASERARARALTEVLQGVTRELRGHASPEQIRTLETLRSRQRDLEATRVYLRTSGALAASDAVEKEIGAVLVELDRAETATRQASPSYAAAAPEALSLQRVRSEVLVPDLALVEYAVGEQRSFVFVLTKDSFAVQTIPGRAALETMVRDAQALLTARNRMVDGENAEGRRNRIERADRDLNAALESMQDTLLRPVAEALKGHRLLVVPDGPLHLVPFGALRSGGKPLVSGREVVVVPSASALAALRRVPEKAAPAGAVAVLADPVFRPDDARVSRRAKPLPADANRGANGSFPRLRFSRREAEMLESAVVSGKKLIALDFDAQRDVLKKGADYRVLHVATHAVLDNERPERSALVLSLFDAKGTPIDGYVRLPEIFELDLRSELVVLSACDTAAGKEMRGEGLMSLTQGFMHAGAPRVIATLWRIDDRATAELMKHFYRAMLQEGATPAAALRHAQQQLARDPRWAAPYYWAAFVLQGEPG